MSARELWPRPPRDFADVPRDVGEQPINVSSDEDTYRRYLHWLADYLHRPAPKMPDSATLSLEQAWSRVSPLESEIAFWIWEHPLDDYPPDNYLPRHADILHRVELSRILSRVPSHADRYELLDRFYQELGIDSGK
jgi:hypothetical protein